MEYHGFKREPPVVAFGILNSVKAVAPQCEPFSRVTRRVVCIWKSGVSFFPSIFLNLHDIPPTQTLTLHPGSQVFHRG